MTEFQEPGPSYSLFVEMAMAVGTTLFALYMCKGKRDRDVLAEKQAMEDLAAEEDELDEINSKMSKEATQSITKDRDMEKIGTSGGQSREGATDSGVKQKIHTVPVDVKATQTEGGQLEDGNAEDTDLKILWKAVVVNDQERTVPRYRTELHVDVDGTVTHSEMFQKEGIAGVGMKQVLVKVQ